MRIGRVPRHGNIMTKRHAEEPYTFAGATVRLEGLEALHGGEADAALKDSVAAHQAVCGCHAATYNDVRAHTCCSTDAYYVRTAQDSAGRDWHIDPLCKVRPEAKA